MLWNNNHNQHQVHLIIKSFIPDSLEGRLALGGSILTLVAGGAILPEIAPADAQSATPTPLTETATGAPTTPEQPAMSDANVELCQERVLGSGRTAGTGFLKSSKFRYKLGSRTVKASVTLKQPRLPSGEVCSDGTRNSVKLQLMQEVWKNKAGTIYPVVRKVGGPVTPKASRAAQSTGTTQTATTARARLLLPTQLTKQALKAHDYAVVITVSSEPLPTTDPTDPTHTIPRSIRTTSKPKVVRISSSQVAN